MKTTFVSAVLALVLAAGPAAAAPPEPLPMGVPYAYQPGNPYWYRVLVPQPSYYPFGSLTPVFGRYSWDYVGSAYPVGMGWYQSPLAAAPYWSYGYPAWYTYPTPAGRVWYGFGW